MLYKQRILVGNCIYVYPTNTIEPKTEGHMYVGCIDVNCKHIINCNQCIFKYAKTHQFQIETVVIQNYDEGERKWK